MHLGGKIRILGFAGSLRKDSLSKAVLKAAKELAPSSAEVEIFDLEGLPLFNQDLEDPFPEKAREFKSRIETADAVLIVTPELNHSVSAVLKNAIEWGSRPDGKNSFANKPGAIMTVSGDSMLGGARAEMHLREICVDVNMHVLNRPRMYLSFGEQKVTDGRLTDEKSRAKVKEVMEALAAWAAALNGPKQAGGSSEGA